jgi:hypothetical protein
MIFNIDIIKDIAQRAALPPEKVLHESLKAYLVNKKKAYILYFALVKINFGNLFQSI